MTTSEAIRKLSSWRVRSAPGCRRCPQAVGKPDAASDRMTRSNVMVTVAGICSLLAVYVLACLAEVAVGVMLLMKTPHAAGRTRAAGAVRPGHRAGRPGLQ
jgi:hypothetical protein